MDDHVFEQLKHVLLKHRDRLGSWTKLSDAIADTNDRRRDRHIDRRTLERICGDGVESVQLRIAQLVALDQFLVLYNESPLLTKRLSPIDSIAESFSVNFLVAANYHPAIRDDTIARWDLRALTRLMRTRVNELRVRIWDITGPDNWRDSDPRIVNSANIAIGSPVANFASEMLLSRMVGVTAQSECPIGGLPFAIVCAARDKDVKSVFVRDRRDAAQIDPIALEDLESERRGIAVGGRLYVSTANRDYGLLIAQRSPANGQVQMVLCGLTGQATYQLARILQGGEPACALPPLLTGEEHPPILLTLYEFTLVPDEQGRGRNTHRVISFAPVIGPAFLHYIGQQWQFVHRDGTRGGAAEETKPRPSTR